MGNHSDQVGLLLQGHYYRVVMGLKAELIWDDIGFGVITATVHWSHDTPAIVGGGTLADEFGTVPMTLAKRHVPLDVLLWELACKHFMREGFRRFIEVKDRVQDI